MPPAPWPALPPPPRSLGLLVRLRATCAGLLATIGWSVVAFGSLFCWVFLTQADWSQPAYWGARLEHAPARVEPGVETRCSVNEQTIYAFRFTATLPEGGEIHGTSYGTWCRHGSGAEAGLARAEWPEGRPELARLTGLRRAIFPIWIAFVLCFPAIGLLLAGIAWRRGWRQVRLLERGIAVRGCCVGSAPTSSSVNGERLHRARYIYRADGREHEVSHPVLAGRLPCAGEEATVLHHPDRGEEAIVLDAPWLEPHGEGFRCRTPLQALALLTVPGAVLAGNLLAAWWLLPR